MKKNYEKINLRKFRHNLSQLKDSLSAGQIYEVIERGKTFAYFVPSTYDIKITKKEVKREEISKILKDSIGCVKTKKYLDYKKQYLKDLRKKYLP